MSEIRPPQHVRDDLDRRIEIVPMDRFCEQITVALYAAEHGSAGIVHSYSSRPGVASRLAWLADAMRRIAGMAGSGRTVSFACGRWHERATRRVFLEASKLDPSQPVRSRPLDAHDTRRDQAIVVTPLGRGVYRVTATAADPTAPGRAGAVATGLAKLADLEIDPADDTVVRFPCGAPHDELVGLLLPRAVNVRAALREQELAASRGVLVAPSAQGTAS